MTVDFFWLMITTAVLFASAQILQSSKIRIVTMAAYTVVGLFAARRLFELAVFALGKAATGVNDPLPWGAVFTWSTLGVMVVQYIIAVIVLALLFRYDEKAFIWMVVLAIGSIGLTPLLV